MSTKPLPNEPEVPPSKGFQRLKKFFQGEKPVSNGGEVHEVDQQLLDGQSTGTPGSKSESKARISSGTTTSTRSWSNWAGTRTAHPARIFDPETIEDLIEIIQRAKTENKKIRCACSGYTWSSSSVVQEDGFLVVMNKMDKIYNPVRSEGDVWTVEVETGVLVKSLDDLLRNHDPPLALPSNVTSETMRFGGILSLGCHGAATNTRTMPDLVDSVKIMDANGNMNMFSKDVDPVEFSAATVNLGLLGIIYSYTLRVEPMFKLHVVDKFLPFHDYISSPERDGPKLKALVENNYQTGIFYSPFNRKGFDTSNDFVWVKTWRKTTDLPLTETPKQTQSQKRQQKISLMIANKIYQFMAAHPGSTSFINRVMFPMVIKEVEKVQYAPDALHFLDGVDHLKCLVLGMALKADANFENVVKAWNFVIDEIYEHARRGEFPLNIAIEMRFVKSSQMMLSNAYDEDPEAIYCMYEVVTAVGTKGFEEFSAKVAKHWMEEFQARTHWAKVWEHIPEMVPYLREVAGARSRLDVFERIRKKYDPEGMFMNKTFAGLLGH
ncbi:MAG: hypothetical protein J3Q66DRAFT_43056 [Benniella sp.]|nr:MAG: hypothetical protein J3Q66DRAFT_43056 [Benniella sp.]